MDFKKGDTFDFSGPVTATVNGVDVADFTGWSARSQVRDQSDSLVAELEVTWMSRTPGVVRLRSTTTTNWPEGGLMIDIQFTAPDATVVSTATEWFNVVRDVTR
jgi:hypothetical protein